MARPPAPRRCSPKGAHGMPRQTPEAEPSSVGEVTSTQCGKSSSSARLCARGGLQHPAAPIIVPSDNPTRSCRSERHERRTSRIQRGNRLLTRGLVASVLATNAAVAKDSTDLISPSDYFLAAQPEEQGRKVERIVTTKLPSPNAVGPRDSRKRSEDGWLRVSAVSETSQISEVSAISESSIVSELSEVSAVSTVSETSEVSQTSEVSEV